LSTEGLVRSTRRLQNKQRVGSCEPFGTGGGYNIAECLATNHSERGWIKYIALILS
jgi:hypothetical protein